MATATDKKTSKAKASKSKTDSTQNDGNKETLGFQAEAKQLLHLMIHSLYSNQEIFLRELISNASDAADKLRFEALANSKLYEKDPDLKIIITFDKDAKTVTISDNGIGMSKDDVITHLGTIARSGTSEFLKNLSGDQKKDSQLIGQFGVGFYSAFIVAKKVEVLTRRAGLKPAEGVHWISTGEADFSVATVDKADRGTTVILHLRDDCETFADDYRLRSIVKKYSDHIAIPVMMEVQAMPEEPESIDKTDETGDETNKPSESVEKSDQTPKEDQEPPLESINQATALWTCSRSEIKDEEYKSFYQHISHDFEEPLTWSHNRVEGKLEYNSLLYVPKRAPFDLWNRDAARGLKLYVQRTFIMDDAEQFLPLYLRFIKGVVDSNDLSLNVSREILQQDPAVTSMKSALTKRVLDMLTKLTKQQEDYQSFWEAFGQVLKEGPAEDFSNREKIAKLLRFSSTHTGKEKQDQSLDDYIARMKAGQEHIYYVTAENFTTANSSPHLEVFRKKGIEVLLLFDRIDEWLTSHLTEYDGKSFENVAKGELDLGKLDSEDDKKAQETLEADNKALTERVKSVLGDKVDTVRTTHRLTESPTCLVLGKQDLGIQMRHILEQAGQKVPESKPIFELNPEHPLINKLDQEPDEDRFKELVAVLFDQSHLAAGEPLENPAAYVQRLNNLLLELSH